MARPQDAEARSILLNWINETLTAKGWRAYNWTLAASIADTSLTRFMKNPDTAPIPSATTIVALAKAAQSNPILTECKKIAIGKNLPLLDGKLLTLMLRCTPAMEDDTMIEELAQLTDRRVPVVAYDASARAFGVEVETRSMNAAGLLPGDHLVVEPMDVCPPRLGDTVITQTSTGEIQPLRFAGDWLKPVSTDPQCEPMRTSETHVFGTVIQLSRPMRPMGFRNSKSNGKETIELV